MASNIAVTPGVGATVAADDIGAGLLAQRVKLALGATGTGIDATGGSGAVGTDTLRVTVGTTDTVLGPVTETAPATDTASSGVNGRLQRVAQRLTSLIALFTATAGQDANRLPIDIRDGELVAPTSVTSATTIVTLDMAGYAGFTFQFTSAGAGNTWTTEASDDNSSWIACNTLASNSINGSTIAPAISAAVGTVTSYYMQRVGRYHRVRISTYGSGTVTLVGSRTTAQFLSTYGVIAVQGLRAGNASASGNPIQIGAAARTTNNAAQTDQNTVIPVATSVGVLVQKPFSIPELDWSFACAAGGIVNTTTAVTVKAAAGAGLRNYITGMSMSADALTAATEFVIRDGAAGTVLWRGKIPTSGNTGREIIFNSPLRGTANTLLEVATLTATVTGGVFFNLWGYAAP